MRVRAVTICTRGANGYVKHVAIAGHRLANWAEVARRIWLRVGRDRRWPAHGTTGEAPRIPFERDEASVLTLRFSLLNRRSTWSVIEARCRCYRSQFCESPLRTADLGHFPSAIFWTFDFKPHQGPRFVLPLVP
jgi:hypothetical protein